MSGIVRSSLNSSLGSMRSAHSTWVQLLEDYKVTDEVGRYVTVYLCREPLVKAGWESITHWSVFFYFKDIDLYIVYEAGEVNGKLTPSRSLRPSLPQSDEKEMMHDQIGTLTISQAALHRAALANHLNYMRYCVETNNCQNWAWVLCKILGINEELKKISTFFSTIKMTDVIVNGALGISAACAIAGLGWSLISGNSSKETDEEESEELPCPDSDSD